MTDQVKDNPSDSEKEQNLANQAHSKFGQSSYEECIILLRKLSDLRPTDARILLNKSIAEYYQSHCCRTDELRKQLAAVKKQVCEQLHFT